MDWKGFWFSVVPLILFKACHVFLAIDLEFTNYALKQKTKHPQNSSLIRKQNSSQKAVFLHILELFYDLVYGRFPRKTLSDPENPL